MFYAFFVLTLFGNTLAASVKSPSTCCPKVTTLTNFNAERYIGRWYDQTILRPKNDDSLRCLVMDYHLDQDKSLTLVYSTLPQSSDTPVFGNATSRIPNLVEPTKFKLRHSSDPDSESNYWILGTDYDSYALTYGCDDSDGNCDIYATILTREVIPSQSVIDKALEVANKNNLDISLFHRTESTLCAEKFIESRFGGPNEDDQLDGEQQSFTPSYNSPSEDEKFGGNRFGGNGFGDEEFVENRFGDEESGENSSEYEESGENSFEYEESGENSFEYEESGENSFEDDESGEEENYYFRW